MRRLLPLTFVAVSAGCVCVSTTPPDTECVRNTDCSRGRVCADGLCVDPPTAGGSAAAGGAAGGSPAGGGATSGGAAGGATGGGAAGGATSGGAAGGATGGGAAGGATSGGAAGGATGGGAAGGATGGGGGSATGGGASGGTAGGVAGGAAGGPTCSCADWEECVNGVVCVPRYALLQWRSPAPNALFASGSLVSLEAALLVAAGRTRNDPPTLMYQASGDGGVVTGTLTRVDAGVFTASTSFGVGTWSATVSWPDAGLADGPLVFSVRPADFEVSWAPPPGRMGPPGVQTRDPLDDGSFFRRDEQTRLVVRNLAAATGVSISVRGVGLDGGAPETSPLLMSASCPECAGQPGFCGCFQLDLAAPTLEAFRGRFGFRVWGVVASQMVMQTSDTHPATIPTLPVTRWKWALAGPFDGGSPVPGNSVLDPSGNLITSFFQQDAGALDFGVASLSPAGSSNWVSRVGNVTTDLAVTLRDGGSDVVFGSQSRGFIALSTATGDGGVTCTPPMSGIISGGLALVQGGALLPFDVPVSLSLVPPSTHRLIAAIPFSGSSCFVQSIPGSGAMAASADRASIANNGGGSIFSTNVLGATSAIGYPPGVTSVWQLIPQTGAGGLLGAGNQTFSLLPTSVEPGQATGFGAQASDAYWLPVSGMPGPALARYPFGAVLSPVTTPTIPLPGAAASVSLGAGGTVYVSTDNGALLAVSGNEVRWSLPAEARLPGTFSSTLLLDCARDGLGAKLAGRPGVAYLVGAPLRVQAVITDSAGLDVTQPWPMHRHDPRGTNNRSTPLSEFACP